MKTSHAQNGFNKDEDAELLSAEKNHSNSSNAKPQASVKHRQRCASIKTFTGVFSVCALTTQVLTFYLVSQITAIEKQFGLTSGQSGFLLSCNDIGFLCTTFLASFLTYKVHIPRTLWASIILYGAGGIICALAYFIAKDLIQEQTTNVKSVLENTSNHYLQRNLSSTTGISSGLDTQFMNASMTSLLVLPNSIGLRRRPPLCLSQKGNLSMTFMVVNGSSTCESSDQSPFGIGVSNKYTKTAIFVIALGMIIQGVAKSVRQPFVVTYVDNNVQDRKYTPLYMGMISGASVFGPVVGFAVGGVFGRMYVTLQDMPISMRHPAWIGAWWMGFIVFGIASIVVSFPLLCFPRTLKRASQPPDTEDNHKIGKTSPVNTVPKEFFQSLKRLVTNATFMSIVLSGAVKLLGSAGLLSFLPKYMENQYSLPAWRANVIMGGANVLAAGIGTLLGGVVVSRAKLSPIACIKMVIVLTILPTCLIATGLALGCEEAKIVGFIDKQGELYGNATCQSECGCHGNSYFPVCGSDNVSYMTPCHAGCAEHSGFTFTDCSCIGRNGSARAGLCMRNCGTMYPYIIAFAAASFIGPMGIMASLIAQIRSVKETDKPMAVGMSSLLMTVFGFLAGPIMMGNIIDSACVHWNGSCQGHGACAIFDLNLLRVRFHLGALIPLLVSILLAVIAFWTGRKKADWTIDKDDQEHEESGTVMLSN